MASIVLGLSKWYEALATGTARAVVFGDSISEGTGATDASKRWQTLLQRRFAGSGAEFPFIPSWPNTTAPGMPVARAGNVGQSGISTTRGLGWRMADLRDETSVLTFTFSGTSAKLHYLRSSATAVMQVSIDGGAAVVVDTNSVRAGGASEVAMWATGPLADGVHTVEVRRSTTSPVASEYVYVGGLFAFREDEAAGLRFLDASKHGISSAYLTTDRRTRAAELVQALGGANLAVVALGTNDYSGGTAPAVFRANIEALVSRIRDYGFAGSVLLVGMYLAGGRDADLWQQYHSELEAIALSDPNTAYLDLRNYMPRVPSPSSAPSGLGYYADALHPSDAGYARMAEIIGAALTATLIDITAELVTSAGSPAPVRIVVDGVPPGAEYAVMGSTGGGSSWAVPGGAGVGDGGQIVLVDNRSALNTPVTYSVLVGGVTYTADPVTVAHDGRAVLQSLDGGISVDFVWLSNSLPREPQINTVAFNVPGRRRPPMRYAPGGDGGGELLIRADRENNAAIGALLQSGRPILVRTDGTMRDWPAVELITLVSAPSRLWEAVEGGQLSTQRVWNLSFLFADDPEPSRVLSAWTWDDFNEAAATSFPTWAAFNALFTGQTWADFNTTDWGQYQ